MAKQQENSENPSSKFFITLGMEFEVHRIQPPLITGHGSEKREKHTAHVYREQLEKSKISSILNYLKIQQLFPDYKDTTSYLCLIKHNDQKFMEVIFDDVNDMGRLEFISLAVGGGILEYKNFLAKGNLILIQNAVKAFPEAMKKIDTSSKEGTIIITHEKGFIFEVPPYAKNILTNIKVDQNLRNAGTIHVTHSYPLTDDSLNASAGFIKAVHGSSFRKKSFHQEEKDFTSGNLHTSTRTNFTPSPKCPKEVLQKDYGNDEYIRAVMKDEALYPFSNTAEYLLKDIEIYKKVLSMVEVQYSEALDPARKILNNTINLLEKKIGTKKGDKLIFNSPEEKFQPLILKGDITYFLVEHRAGSLQEFVQGFIKNSSYKETSYSDLCKLFDKLSIPDNKEDMQENNGLSQVGVNSLGSISSDTITPEGLSTSGNDSPFYNPDVNS